jgi:glucose/mannose transport system substrate-binding protein
MPAQLAYNRIKGSVPVRRDLSASGLASLGGCARDSWETFASPAAARVPSLAHRMAADEATKDAVAQSLWRYLTDPRMDAQEAQKRLASVIRTP